MKDESLDALVIAIDFRGPEVGADPWPEAARLQVASALASHLAETVRGSGCGPVGPSEGVPAPPPQPVEGLAGESAEETGALFEEAVAELTAMAERLGVREVRASFDTACFVFEAAAYRSAIRLALEALKRNAAGWTADRVRRFDLGVGVARGSLRMAAGVASSTGAVLTVARRLSVLAPADGLLTCPRGAALFEELDADVAPVREGVFQVLWVRPGGPLEKRRAMRVDVSEEIAVELDGGVRVEARTVDVSRTGVRLELASPAFGGMPQGRVRLDLSRLHSDLGSVEGQVVSDAPASTGAGLRVAFQALDDARRRALVQRLYAVQPARRVVDLPSRAVEQPVARPRIEALAEAFRAFATARSVEDVSKTVVHCASRACEIRLPSFKVDLARGSAAEDGSVHVLALPADDGEINYLVRCSGRFDATLRGSLPGAPSEEAERCLNALLTSAAAALSRVLTPAARSSAAPPERDASGERLLAAQMAAGIGTAFSLLAHDLNNTLTPLLGLSAFLAEREDLPVDARRELARVQLYGEQVAETVARLQAYQRRLGTIQVFDLHRVALDVAALWRTRLDGARIQLACTLDASQTSVRGDALQTTVLFHHLIENACEAIRRSGRPGRIDIRSFDTDEGSVVEIADNGCGVDADLQASAFDAFVSDVPEEARGLGLAIGRAVARRLGASLEIRDSGLQGTVMRLALRAPVSVAQPASMVEVATS